jgi:polyphenol oxidase
MVMRRAAQIHPARPSTCLHHMRKAIQVIRRRGTRFEYLLFERLVAEPALTHGVFTRLGGYSAPPYQGLNLSFITGDDAATVQRNRDAVVDALGLPLVAAKPVHEASVVVVERALGDGSVGDEESAWVERLRERLTRIEADAMLTDVPGFALCWAFGDCAPILLYDPRHHAIALVHAGWRGTAAAVVPAAIGAMTRRYGTRPQDLYAGLGPAIGACCYEVNETVRKTFAANALAWESAHFEERRVPAGARLYLGVAASNHAQLVAVGVTPEHIEDCGYCTGCRTDLFYSNRREPQPTGRFAVAFGLRAVRQ